MINSIMNLEYKLDISYFFDCVLSFKRSLMLVFKLFRPSFWVARKSVKCEKVLLSLLLAEFLSFAPPLSPLQLHFFYGFSSTQLSTGFPSLFSLL